MEMQLLLLTLVLIVANSQVQATHERNDTKTSSNSSLSPTKDDIRFEDYFWDEDDPKKSEADEAFENYFGEDTVPENQKGSHHRHHHNHTRNKQRQQADEAFDNYFGDDDEASNSIHDDHSKHKNHNDHMDHDMSDNGHTMDMMHSMKMYFHASVKAVVLLEEWNISSWLGMLGSCIVIVIVGALYEGLKVLKEEISFRCPGKGSCCSCCSCLPQRMCRGIHFLQTLLHVFQVFVSYLLMLVFMTYNIYLCISVLIGAALGYFLFRWRTRDLVGQEEHCN